MKNRIIGYFIFFFFALVCFSYWYYFVHTHEQKTREIITFTKKEARSNRYLASTLFLEKLNIPTESLMGRKYLLNPPAKTGLLLIEDMGEKIPKKSQEKLWQWVEQGGHLVFQAPHHTDQSINYFLDQLNVSVKSRYDDFFKKEEDELKTCPIKTWKDNIKIPIFPESFTISAYASNLLIDNNKTAAWSIITDKKEGYFALQYPIKKGKITVLSNLNLFKNRRLHKEDNALFLAILADQSKQAWLLYQADSLSLLELTWQNLPLFIINLIIFGILFLWWNSRYTGPRLKLTGQSRRNLMEHLYASANYTWQIDKNKKLLQRNQQTTLQKWKNKHPNLNKMTQAEVCQWIAEVTGLKPLEVEQALYLVAENSPDFLHSSYFLQKLNK